jgi:hypothetical protein
VKLNKLATYLLSALVPTLLLSSSAGADPTSGPIYGTPVTMDQATINLSETLNADSSGWVVTFDQYDQSGQLAQYTVTTDTGDSCTVLTAATGQQENCTLGLVNNDSTVTPVITSVTYDPVIAMASGLNPGGVMTLGEGATTTTTIAPDIAPISLDTTNVTVTDNGDGTYTLTIPNYTGQTDAGTYTFTTSAGDTCTNEVAATATAECTITPSDGQQPIVDSVTWYPILAGIRMYSMARADTRSSALSATSGNGVPTGGSSLWAAGIIAAITTLGVFWLNSRARRRSH